MKTAVTLVAHGLNLVPEAMLPLINWLRAEGSDVYLVQLSGHHHKGVDISNVTSAVWQKEMQEAYNVARITSLDGSVPLFFLGYSLGALLAQSMITSSLSTTFFDKQVLMAPAIGIRRASYLVKLLFPLGRQRRLPSFTPKGYRVNKSLPLNIYNILFTEEKRILSVGFNQSNIPTLVIMDPKDELVSYKRIKKHISRFSLADCRLLVLDHQLKDRRGGYHHLIIDEQTMGKRNWAIVTQEIKRLFFPFQHPL